MLPTHKILVNIVEVFLVPFVCVYLADASSLFRISLPTYAADSHVIVDCESLGSVLGAIRVFIWPTLFTLFRISLPTYAVDSHVILDCESLGSVLGVICVRMLVVQQWMLPAMCTTCVPVVR